jgi:hypothetical protein
MNICQYLLHFDLILIRFGAGDVHKKLLHNCEFHENLDGESHILLMVVN